MCPQASAWFPWARGTGVSSLRAVGALWSFRARCTVGGKSGAVVARALLGADPAPPRAPLFSCICGRRPRARRSAFGPTRFRRGLGLSARRVLPSTMKEKVVKRLRREKSPAPFFSLTNRPKTR